MRSVRRSILTLVAVPTLALGAVACGDDTADTGDAGDDTRDAATDDPSDPSDPSEPAG